MKKTFSGQQKIVFSIVIGVLLFMATNWIVHIVFLHGLKRYYCLEPADVLCIGHSMTEMGIDKKLLEEKTGLKVAKFCINGAGTNDRLVMLKQYLECTVSNPKLVIYDVSARSFSEGLSRNSYALFYPFMDDSAAVDEYIQKEVSPWEYWQKKIIPLTRYDDTRLGAVCRGYQGNWQNIQTRTLNTEEFSRNIKNGRFWKISFNQEAIDTFDETLKYLQARHIRVLLLALPSAKQLNDAEPEKNHKALRLIIEESQKYSQVLFIDFNQEYSAHSELFFDPIHLNRNGQIQVTNRLADEIERILL